MATSSILTSVKITDPKKIESFIKALDASADDGEERKEGKLRLLLLLIVETAHLPIPK